MFDLQVPAFQADIFVGAHDPQQILTHDLANVSVGVPISINPFD